MQQTRQAEIPGGLPARFSSPTPGALHLAEGLRHHAAGRFVAAAHCYQSALAANSNHPDTLLLLGILARQTRQYAAAITLIHAAIAALPPSSPAAHFYLNLAHAHHAAGNLSEAEAACRHSLAHDPHSAPACCRLADILSDRGKLDEARRCCEAAITAEPRFARAYYSLGNILCRQGNNAAAVASYKHALALAPMRAEFYFALGYSLNRLHRPFAARAAFVMAIRLHPRFAEAHLNLGNLYYDHGHSAAAALHYLRALRIRPGYVKAIINLGNALTGLNRLSEAISCYRHALVHQPASFAAQHGLGNALADQKDWAAAQDCFQKALALDPSSADVHNSLGNLHYSRKNMADAAESYRRALALDSNYARAYVNLGNAVLALGKFNEARSLYEKGFALEASLPGARYNLALAQLRNGEFSDGWRNYESRWDFEELRLRRRHASTPLWRGQPLDGKTILLHAEQGLGDTLQFVRFAPLVAARGGRIILEVQPPLTRLLKDFPGVTQIVPRGAPLPAFDFQCPLMSLPLALGTTVEAIPSPGGYLKAEPRCSAISCPNCLRIGIAWSGNPRNKADASRSMPLSALLPIADVPGLTLISLQKGAGVEQIVPLRDRLDIQNAASTHADMLETATFMASLDLVLTVDTSIAHLAGAMAKPVWIMLSWISDWRWMEQRTTSPWYSSARLFRQTSAGDWASVVAQVLAALCDQKRKAMPPFRIG